MSPLMAKNKGTSKDMRDAHAIYIGWVDMSADDYRKQGYSSREQYQAVLDGANIGFQKDLQSRLSGRTVNAAKKSSDTDAAGNDVYIKFSDAYYDRGYRLHVAVHFIDVKTNAEIGSIPLTRHGAHLCGFEGCLNKELEEVSKEISEQFGAK
jgi:hypothetical protein